MHGSIHIKGNQQDLWQCTENTQYFVMCKVKNLKYYICMCILYIYKII